MPFALLWLGNRNLPALGECWRTPEPPSAAATPGEQQLCVGVLKYKVFSNEAVSFTAGFRTKYDQRLVRAVTDANLFLT